MPTSSLDRLYANLGTIIKDGLFLNLTHPLKMHYVSEEKLTALAEALYLEVVAEYQPEPGIYGLADDAVEEDWATEGGE
tara:strand:+ start:231 stop:467 length:237 start_codon:yes stop_codon:yes gene_type:complete